MTHQEGPWIQSEQGGVHQIHHWAVDHGQEKWLIHDTKLYHRKGAVSASALDTIEGLPALHEINKELNKAINSLASRKAPSNHYSGPPQADKHVGIYGLV